MIDNLNSLIKPIGYAEMYELTSQEQYAQGRFVGFSKEQPNKIELFDKTKNDFIVGVSSACSAVLSDIHEEWPKKYKSNEYGDAYVTIQPIAVGSKEYDEINERPIICTRRADRYVPFINEEFDENQQYVNRLNRKDWIRVVLLGKAIVTDNGVCKPGEWCKPYEGKDEELKGTAVKATSKDKNSFYVVDRYSDSTIIILVK